ncbi:MAG: argininosuccinate lyase [Roseicyclus sp.]|nr:argininosuccinate lyase [Roseicyclus sp.]
MRYVVLLSFIGTLAACGVDGAPERPDRAAPAPGLSVTGTVSVGVGGSF